MTLDGLCRAVAARIDPRQVGGPLAAALIQIIWTRIRRAEGKLQALLVRFQAGRLRVVTVRRPVVRARVQTRACTVPRGPTATLPRSPTAKLPRGFAWLLPMVPCHAANFSSQLRVLLAEPEMMALLQASAQARRVLAPLCRMLGIEAPVPVVRVSPPLEVAVAAPPVQIFYNEFNEILEDGPEPQVRPACRGSPSG